MQVQAFSGATYFFSHNNEHIKGEKRQKVNQLAE